MLAVLTQLLGAQLARCTSLAFAQPYDEIHCQLSLERRIALVRRMRKAGPYTIVYTACALASRKVERDSSRDLRFASVLEVAI